MTDETPADAPDDEAPAEESIVASVEGADAPDDEAPAPDPHLEHPEVADGSLLARYVEKPEDFDSEPARYNVVTDASGVVLRYEKTR